MSTEQARARGRGRYGERRLAGKVNGVIIGRSKAVQLPESKRYVQIDIQHPCDVLNETFAFESKWIKHAPASIKKVMTQAMRNTPFGFIPVGVIGGREAKEVYYIFTEPDFLGLHVGNIPTRGPERIRRDESRPKRKVPTKKTLLHVPRQGVLVETT